MRESNKASVQVRELARKKRGGRGKKPRFWESFVTWQPCSFSSPGVCGSSVAAAAMACVALRETPDKDGAGAAADAAAEGDTSCNAAC